MAKIGAGVVRRTPVVISEEDSYIVLSKHTSEQEVERWDSAFKKLNERGKIAALQKQFIPADQ